MQVTLDSGVKEWLIKKGNVLTVSRYEAKSCCIGYEDVDVKYRVPKKGDYKKLNVDELTIYIDKNIRFKHNHLILSLTGLGPFKQIYVDGLEYRGIWSIEGTT